MHQMVLILVDLVLRRKMSTMETEPVDYLDSKAHLAHRYHPPSVM